MRRWIVAVIVIGVAGGAGTWFAFQRYGVKPPTAIRPEPQIHEPMHEASDGVKVAKGCDDLAHTIRAAVSRGGPIPEGTRLLSIALEGDECVIEMSSEFAEVNNRGTTGESEAQNALCAALAAFDRVKTMRLIVDGAVFEGSHSGEWSGVPVRGGETQSSEDL